MNSCKCFDVLGGPSGCCLCPHRTRLGVGHSRRNGASLRARLGGRAFESPRVAGLPSTGGPRCSEGLEAAEILIPGLRAAAVLLGLLPACLLEQLGCGSHLSDRWPFNSAEYELQTKKGVAMSQAGKQARVIPLLCD